MKTYKVLPLAALLLASSFTLACKKETTDTTTDTSATTMSSTDSSGTTSTTVTTDTATTGATPSGTSGMSDTSSTGASGGTASSLSKEDKEFVMKAAQGGMAEVAMGNMAASKGTNPDVKAFGNQMVTDHGKASDELKQLATTKGLAMPTDIGHEFKEVSEKLSKKSGTDFDKAYMNDMVKDHEEDIKEFTKASEKSTDPDLKAWATKTLPTLKGHLEMAKAAALKVK